MRKKIRILVAAMVGAACVVAAVPADTASATSLPLTVTCHQHPSYCIATGAAGPLFGETFLSPRGDEALICISAQFFCSVAGAELIVEPSFVAGAAVAVGNFAELELAPRFVGLVVAGGTLAYELDVIANNGAEALILLVAGHRKCLFINGLTITAPPC